MAKFRVTSPDGATYEITAPDGATEQEAVAYAQQQFGGSKAATKPSTVKDVAKSAATGVVKGVQGLASMGESLTPGGMTRNILNRFGANIPSPMAPMENAVNQFGHKPETRAGRYAEAVGEMAPNALAPGGLARRAASVVLPAVAGEGAREATEALGGNQLAQGAAKFGGAVLGGLGSSGAVAGRLGRGRTALGALPAQDANALTQRAAQFRGAGIQPTLIDVIDDSGRGAVRAAASRMTPARQRATDFQDGRQLDLPSRIGGQARRVMSQDPRTPDQIRAEMATRRAQNADQAFGAVRGDTVHLAPEGVQALRSDYGRAAIREAARRERDPNTRAALMRLGEAALDNPSTPITVGMADRVSRVLLGQSQEAARRGDNDLATTLGGLGRSVRGPTAEASPGYADALQGYGADSRLQEAAGVGENLMTRNTDEFVPQAQNLSDDERALALAAGRRAIERRAGENVGAAPGVARQIANAPEQQARNAALMGPARAGQLQDAMRLEERAVRNANDIAPRTGSQTQLRGQDAANMASAVARIGGQVARSDYVGMGIDFLRSRGMNDQQAQALVEMALDPRRTDQAIQLIARQYGPLAAHQALQWRNAAMLSVTAGANAEATQ